MNIFFVLVLFVPIRAFILEQANISVWLSAAAYCDKKNYAVMKLTGPTDGFLVKDIIHDSKTDLQGYIGVLPSSKTLYIVFRGSSSIRNWIEDAEFKKIAYNTFPSCECSVHDGFYKSALAVIDQIVPSVKSLHQEYNYDIIVTGHSYGAAVAQLIAMELLERNINSVVYNFGQPRIGDVAYSKFVNARLKELWRVVHNYDIVPHIPPIKVFDFYHSFREVFEN
jgi:predicted lipase